MTYAVTFDHDLLARFEAGINPTDLSRSRLPAEVLGYGEMSTVLTLADGDPDLVYKRMPMFYTEAEIEAYLALYHNYQAHLAAAGVTPVAAGIAHVVPQQGNGVVYIVQKRLSRGSLVNQAIHFLDDDEVYRLFMAILENVGRVADYNRRHQGQVALGLDAQMSNWAIQDFGGVHDDLPASINLTYIDTSSPLMQIDEVEQLDPELFLRSAPSFLRWVIRLLFLKDVLSRYYNQRQIIIDVLANLYKEKRAEVIPQLVDAANDALAALPGADAAPITEKEVAAYYREDARIWQVYLTFRRLDRWLHRRLGRPYPYVLPGNIER